MNNNELEQKVREIIALPNFFDMLEAAYDFNKEYVLSDFYKKTKIKLADIIVSARDFYNSTADILIDKMQDVIDGIDVERLTGVLEQTDAIFTNENEAAVNSLQTLKEILGK